MCNGVGESGRKVSEWATLLGAAELFWGVL